MATKKPPKVPQYRGPRKPPPSGGRVNRNGGLASMRRVGGDRITLHQRRIDGPGATNSSRAKRGFEQKLPAKKALPKAKQLAKR